MNVCGHDRVYVGGADERRCMCVNEIAKCMVRRGVVQEVHECHGGGAGEVRRLSVGSPTARTSARGVGVVPALVVQGVEGRWGRCTEGCVPLVGGLDLVRGGLVGGQGLAGNAVRRK